MKATVNRPGSVTLTHARGQTRARYAIFCAGDESDRLAVMAGASPDPRSFPFAAPTFVCVPTGGT